MICDHWSFFWLGFFAGTIAAAVIVGAFAVWMECSYTDGGADGEESEVRDGES